MTAIALHEPSQEGSVAPDLRRVAQGRAARERRRRDWLPDLPDAATSAAFLAPAALVLELGLDSGGFDSLIYSRVGLAAWWLVLVGSISGVLRWDSLGRPARAGLAVLLAFAAWTAVGVSWSGSAERSMIEAGRVAAYAGTFAVALMLAGRGRVRALLAGVAFGCTAIATVALLSRLQPGWFPANDLADVLPSTRSRLAYPLNYWNALAGLTAIGLPLLIWIATSARTVTARGVAAAFVPLMALTISLTLSRGGMAAAVAGVIALIALCTRRIALVPPMATMAAGAGALIWAAARRPSLRSGHVDDVALAQGDRMLWIVIAVGVVVAVGVMSLALLSRRGRLPAAPAVPRRMAVAALGAVAVLALGAFFVADGPTLLDDGWQKFKEPANPGAQADRLQSASGNGRWQYWSAAVDAFEHQPLHGIGPGTYRFWWTEHRDIPSFVRDAHSLFAETLGELGIVGLLLIAGFVLLAIVVGARRAIATGGPERRALAAACASAIAFAVAAGLDWLWELAVIPVAFLFVAAAILRSGEREPAPEPRRGAAARAAAILVPAAFAAAAIALIAIPMVGNQRVASSQAAFRAGDYEAALDHAEDAASLQPYAATPYLQEAFALERLGRGAEAKAAARKATEAESTNWETWYVLARVEVARGERERALRALREARRLDPLNPLFNPDAADENTTSAPSG